MLVFVYACLYFVFVSVCLYFVFVYTCLYFVFVSVCHKSLWASNSNMYICICVCISIFVFVFCICWKQEISGCLSPGLLLHCDWAGSLDIQAAVIYICKGVFRICVFCISYLYLQDRWLSLTGLDGRQSLCASSSGVYLYRCLCISYLSLYLSFYLLVIFALSMIGGCLSLGWIAAKAFVQAAPVYICIGVCVFRICLYICLFIC